MKKKLFLVTFAVIVFSTAVTAQKKPVFTSSYSSLAVCKEFGGTNGSDPAYLCNGVGGYKVRIYSSALATHLTAELKDDSFPMATVDLAWNQSKAKVEWRLANGKPFAAILRVPTYADGGDGQSFGKVTGSELRVIGLKGQEIEVTVNGKDANANVKAREAADNAYKP